MKKERKIKRKNHKDEKVKTLKIRKREILSKSGLCYQLEFDDKTQECTVTCLNATGACSFLKREIHYAMNPLNLEIARVGFEDITYKCPSHLYQKVIKRIREC